MTNSQEFKKLERAVQQITAGCSLLRSWPLKGGISAEMTALEIETPDGQETKMIVRRYLEGQFKRNPQAIENEFRVLQITKSRGLKTPQPYYLDQSGEIFRDPYVVLEYLEGQMDFLLLI